MSSRSGGSSGSGEDLGFVPNSYGKFVVDFTTGLSPLRDLFGESGYVYTRGGVGGTITDHNGLVKDVPGPVPMIDGSRYVKNIANNPKTFTYNWTKIGTAVLSNTLNQICSYASGDGATFDGTDFLSDAVLNDKYIISIDVTLEGAAGTWRVGETGTAVFSEGNQDVSLALGRQTIALDLTCTTAGTFNPSIISQYADDCVLTVHGVMVENVTNELVQKPSKMVAMRNVLFSDGEFNDSGASWDFAGGGSISYAANNATITFADAQIANFLQDSAYRYDSNAEVRYSGYLDVSNTLGFPATVNVAANGVTMWNKAADNTQGHKEFGGYSSGSTAFGATIVSSGAQDLTLDNIAVYGGDVGSNFYNSQFHNDDNRYVVTSGLITEERKGKRIHSLTTKGVGMWEARTNFADTDDPNTQTIDLSAEATGDYIVSCKGTASFTITAGTATATISDATVTEDSPGKFDMTVAGTMVITLDSGTLDTTTSGDNIIQLEAGTFPTPFIPASGGGVSRSGSALSYAGEEYRRQGAFLVEFDIPYDPADLSAEVPLITFQQSATLANDFVQLSIQADGKLKLAVNRGGAGAQTVGTSTSAMSAGRHKAIFIWHSTKNYCYMYLDGVDETDDSAQSPPAYGDVDKLYIGSSETAANTFSQSNCYITNVTMWNGVLDDDLRKKFTS